MELSSWLALQQHALPRLHIEEGEYLARWWPSRRTYTAAKRSSCTAVTHGSIVFVGALPDDGHVRATVRTGLCEYDFEPIWIIGRGLGACRLSPADAARPIADESRGCAVAALRRAAEHAYGRLRDLAIDVAGSDWPAVLPALTAGAPVPQPFRDAALAALRSRPLAELMVARAGSRCVSCGQHFERGDAGPVHEVTRSLVLCDPCHRGSEAKAA